MAIIVGGCTALGQAFSGLPKCDVRPDLITRLFLAPKGTLFPIDPVEFNEKLQEYISTGLIVPIDKVVDAPAEGGGVTYTQIGSYGASTGTVDTTTIPFLVDGGICYYRTLKALSGDWDVFSVDRKNFVFGYAKTVGSQEYFCGYEATLTVTDRTPTGGTPYAITAGIAYGVNFDIQRANIHAIKVENIPDGIVGVEVVNFSAGKIKVQGICDGYDYTSQFADSIAPTLFVTQGGTTITSAIYNEADNTITIEPTTSPIKVASAGVLVEQDIFGIGGVDKFITLTQST